MPWRGAGCPRSPASGYLRLPPAPLLRLELDDVARVDGFDCDDGEAERLDCGCNERAGGDGAAARCGWGAERTCFCWRGALVLTREEGAAALLRFGVAATRLTDRLGVLVSAAGWDRRWEAARLLLGWVDREARPGAAEPSRPTDLDGELDWPAGMVRDRVRDC